MEVPGREKGGKDRRRFFFIMEESGSVSFCRRCFCGIDLVYHPIKKLYTVIRI